MDIVSHALWGGIAFGRRSRKAFCIAAGISLLPDVMTEGLFGLLYLLKIGNMPGWEHGHPDIIAYPLWAQNLYNFTHSLIVFLLCFLHIWMFVRKPLWIAGAWGLHILIDIPTHSMALFPTPFLWPLSDYKFDGIGWHHPMVLSANALLLLSVYRVQRRRRKRN